MGTRSLTFVYDHDEPVVCMYNQYDGYPSGVGAELADILAGRTIVNGFGTGTPQKASNGMGCLAATVISEFKTGIGGCYLYPISTKDAGQDYTYRIYEDRVVVQSYRGEQLFDGPWSQFADWCKIDEE